MNKKRIHLIANAHLDPVWLWRWEEGCTEALSTFLTASELIDEYRGFRFNHNEAILYEWVKEHNPELYKRIREQVKEGRWEITGGWYLQPDCNMPCGESMIRNILLGRIFFAEEFGIYPKTAINYDSFGHSKGLVQILAKAGYENYLVYRPGRGNYDFPDADFKWKGFGDELITVHRSDEGYNSVWGQAAEDLKKFLKKREDEEVTLFLWGVGDHGGGPTREDLNHFEQMMQESDYEIIHSTPDEYFKELKALNAELKLVERGLNPVAQGCYTSQIRVKQKHRQLENEIYSTEKMASAAALMYGRKYNKTAFDEAVKALVFSEFHDALPGSSTQPVEEDTIRLLDYGLELMSREKLYSAIALSAGEPKVEPDTSTILIYNFHPYEVTGAWECEVGLPKQNWSHFYYPEVYIEGKRVPTQAEKEFSNFGIDWRKKVVVEATLPASSMTRLDVRFKLLEKRPEFKAIAYQKYFEFRTQDMFIKINTMTGLIDQYEIGDKVYLNPGSFYLAMTDDTYNPWGMGKDESASRRIFQLLTPHEGSAFCGLREAKPSVRVIEDGKVRTVVEALFGLNDSKAYIRYKLPKKGTAFEVEVLVHFAEKEQSLKLCLNTASRENQFLGQIMYGREELKQQGEEVVAQKWVMAGSKESGKGLLVVNNGTYGVSLEEDVLGITLLRSAGYSAADDAVGPALREVQYAPRMEQGIRTYSFLINAGNFEQIADSADEIAQTFNEKPYSFAFCPPGTGEKKGIFLSLDNKAILVSACKKEERGAGYIVRLFEGTGKEQETILRIPCLEICQKIVFKPHEIKTFRIGRENGKIEESSLLENL